MSTQALDPKFVEEQQKALRRVGTSYWDRAFWGAVKGNTRGLLAGAVIGLACGAGIGLVASFLPVAFGVIELGAMSWATAGIVTGICSVAGIHLGIEIMTRCGAAAGAASAVEDEKEARKNALKIAKETGLGVDGLSQPAPTPKVKLFNIKGLLYGFAIGAIIGAALGLGGFAITSALSAEAAATLSATAMPLLKYIGVEAATKVAPLIYMGLSSVFFGLAGATYGVDFSVYKRIARSIEPLIDQDGKRAWETLRGRAPEFDRIEPSVPLHIEKPQQRVQHAANHAAIPNTVNFADALTQQRAQLAAINNIKGA